MSGFMLHLKMNQEGEQGAQNDHDGQNGQFLKIPYLYGFQNLRRHFELQTECQTVCQLEFDVVPVFFDQAVQIMQKRADGGYRHHKDTDQLTQGDQYAENKTYNMFQHSYSPHVFCKRNAKTVELSVV